MAPITSREHKAVSVQHKVPSWERVRSSCSELFPYLGKPLNLNIAF